jgi:alpha-D-xyloside xylohydrolase
VRATCAPALATILHALLPPQTCQPQITAGAELTLRNGNITAVLNLKGQLAFYNQRGELLLKRCGGKRSRRYRRQ